MKFTTGLIRIFIIGMHLIEILQALNVCFFLIIFFFFFFIFRPNFWIQNHNFQWVVSLKPDSFQNTHPKFVEWFYQFLKFFQRFFWFVRLLNTILFKEIFLTIWYFFHVYVFNIFVNYRPEGCVCKAWIKMGKKFPPFSRISQFCVEKIKKNSKYFLPKINQYIF